MTKSIETVTITAGGKSVTVTPEKLAQVADRVSKRAATGTQQSFGFATGHEFLGEEFLLWIWWKWETVGGEFTLPGGRVVGIAIDDLLVFAPKGDDETRQTLKDGLPTRTAEARTALRQGHRIAKAKLIVAEGSRQWVVSLAGDRMQFGAVKLPEDAEEVENDTDRTGDRVGNWLALHEIVSALFDMFLRVRVGTAWKEEAEAIALWMRS